MNYLSVKEEAAAEYLVNKSRFIAYVRPVTTEEEAQHYIETIRKRHWDASHNVPVYVIGEKMQIQRFSDDGEPSGTAGMPMLDMLKKEGITNLVVVVTRYFGGVKLGKGGLVRAYTHSAKLGVEAAGIVSYEKLVRYRLTYDYSFHGKVDNQIRQMALLHDLETDFGVAVTRTVLIPVGSDEMMTPFVELSGGKMMIERLDEAFHCLMDGRVMGG